MRVHHLNCGTLCPWGGGFTDGSSPLFGRARMVCHCLLIEAHSGLVLVDTGLGSRDLASPRARLGTSFTRFASPRLDERETAIAQISKLGFSPADVRHIIITHLDPDHAGGLADFPGATVHVFAPELSAANAPASRHAERRYRTAQWEHRVQWQTYDASQGGDRWFGFSHIRCALDLDGDIALIPLPGHTVGHCGVLVRTLTGWLLHAGDAYFHHDEIAPDRPRCPLGMRLFQSLSSVDAAARIANQERLRVLAREHGDSVRIICSHDAVDFDCMCYFERMKERGTLTTSRTA